MAAAAGGRDAAGNPLASDNRGRYSVGIGSGRPIRHRGGPVQGTGNGVRQLCCPEGIQHVFFVINIGCSRKHVRRYFEERVVHQGLSPLVAGARLEVIGQLLASLSGQR